MEFKVQRKENENIHKYPTEDLKVAEKFADDLKKELQQFLIGVIAFGSMARREAKETSDIDLMVIMDDVTFVVTEPLIEGYKIIVENLIRKTSMRLHITSMTLTSFWEHVKVGDPIIVNILRDGVAIIDQGMFDPLQKLLKQGRIRPSEESVWRYYGRSPKTLLNSRWHVLQAMLDLYWAVIDAAHAALMRANQVPPTPEHVADLLEKVYVKPKKLEQKYADTMRKFYRLSKGITHREIKYVTGLEFEKNYKEADEFVKRMKKLIEQNTH
ncbi:hypothetical protein COV12_01470 [Candidatus Woesearchaeota archaeon CG10_big_fil_rev_8_21_14_0_10_32_24]|nr:MAG: hypothetical protein COV12_01470 [Candidatus Woesearchaeota archaeon CG10_big_fil_rev_8_21_14_0_10_32_24]